VSEKLLHEAGKRGLSGYIVKPAFVLGDSRSGVCNSDDFFWRLIKGCAQLGYMPNLEVSLNAIPVDHLATLISHAALSPPIAHLNRVTTLHVDPVPRITTTQLSAVLQLYGFPIRTCDYSSWVEYLNRAVQRGEENALLPVLDIVSHALGRVLQVPRMDTSNTRDLLLSLQIPIEESNVTNETIALYSAWLVKSGELSSPERSSQTPLLPSLASTSVFNVIRRTGL